MERGVLAWLAVVSMVLQVCTIQNTHVAKLIRGHTTKAETTLNPLTMLLKQSLETDKKTKSPEVVFPKSAKVAGFRWISTEGVASKKDTVPPPVTSYEPAQAVTDHNRRRTVFNFMSLNKCRELPRSSYSLVIDREQRTSDNAKTVEISNVTVILCDVSHLEGKPNETVEICNGTNVIVPYHLEKFNNAPKLYVLFRDFFADGRSNSVCEARIEFTTPSRKENTTSVFRLLTLVTLLPSVLSLICVLITYLIFPQLRTLPGKNLVSLCISLLLIQLIDLSAFETGLSHSLCKSIAIFRHYIVFVSFSNMAVIAFHTRKIFSNDTHVQRQSANKTMKQFVIYFLFSWGMPAVFMVSFIMLGKLGITHINYSLDRICWIDNKSDHLFFFVVPLAGFMAWNILMLCSTIGHIEKTRKQMSDMGSDANRSKRQTSSVIYLKLASLMGFDWLVGLLLYVLPSYSPLLFAFIFLNSLEGVYIAFAFVFTKKTWKMYREKWMCLDRNKTPSSKGRRLTRETHV